MDRKSGFTLIELLIGITIMAVLLTLTVVNLRNSQATARDEKRKADVGTIAQYLETYYRSGSDSPSSMSGMYPSTDMMSTEALAKVTLRDIDPASLRAPNVAKTAPISLIIATSAATPSADTQKYVYQPLKGDGTLCTTTGTECRKFNLFYTLESGGTVQKVSSKNQ